MLALGVQIQQQRLSERQDDAGARTLRGARGDQRREARGQRAQYRGYGEAGDRAHEQR